MSEIKLTVTLILKRAPLPSSSCCCRTCPGSGGEPSGVSAFLFRPWGGWPTPHTPNEIGSGSSSTWQRQTKTLEYQSFPLVHGKDKDTYLQQVWGSIRPDGYICLTWDKKVSKIHVAAGMVSTAGRWLRVSTSYNPKSKETITLICSTWAYLWLYILFLW